MAITGSVAAPLPIQIVVTNATEAAAARTAINTSGCRGVDVLLDGEITYDFDIYPRDCPSDESLHTRFRMTPGSILHGGIRAACDDHGVPGREECACISIEGVVFDAPDANDAMEASGGGNDTPHGEGACVVTIHAWADVPVTALNATNVITGHGGSRFLAINTGGFTATAAIAPSAPFTQNSRSTLIGGSYTGGTGPRAAAYHVGGSSGGQARGQVFGTYLGCNNTVDGASIDIEPGVGGHSIVGVGPTVTLDCPVPVSQEMNPGETFELIPYAADEAVPLLVPLPAWVTGRRQTMMMLR